jgi:hypothetical protein
LNTALFAFCFACEILLAQRPVTVAAMATSAGNFNFAVQGETHLRTFGPNGHPYASTVSEFGFYRSHCKWFLRLRTHVEGGSQTPGIRESQTQVGWDLYFSNLLTIGLVTLWNFGMNAGFNWRTTN